MGFASLETVASEAPNPILPTSRDLVGGVGLVAVVLVFGLLLVTAVWVLMRLIRNHRADLTDR